jgi:uncharacterized iron-regulated protein
MFIAHYQHSPEDVAVGFGNTAVEAAEALVNSSPFLAGKEIDVAEVAPGLAARSLADLGGVTIVVAPTDWHSVMRPR